MVHIRDSDIAAALGLYAEETHLDLKSRLTVLTATRRSASADFLVLQFDTMSSMLLRAQLAVLVVLTGLNTWLGIDKYLYLSVWWWDIPTHFLGGLWMGLFVAWLFQRNKRKITIAQCASFALALGVCWEIFEFSEGLGGSYFMPYWIDTIKDICMDAFGGASAGVLVWRFKNLWRK